MQMGEMSKRASNWTPTTGDGSGNWNGGQRSSWAPSGQSASGLFSTGNSGGMSRMETISKIEQVYRMRTSSVSPTFDPSANPQWTTTSSSSSQMQPQQQQDGVTASTPPTRTYNTSNTPDYSAPPPQRSPCSQPPSSQQTESQSQPPTTSSFWNFAGNSVDDSESSKASLSREGLQFYTFGRFIPRDELASSPAMTTDQWNMGALPPSLPSMTNMGPSGPLGRENGEGGEERDQEGGEEEEVGEEEEEEERVMPSPVNATYAGHTTLPSSVASSSLVASNKNTRSKRSLQSKSGARRGKRKGSADTTALNLTTEGHVGERKLRVRRSTLVPGWAVSPRVLLVDDDIVSRKLGSKFLQVYGCTIDVAVDGESAVNKMNLEKYKYDLVLMVRCVI